MEFPEYEFPASVSVRPVSVGGALSNPGAVRLSLRAETRAVRLLNPGTPGEEVVDAELVHIPSRLRLEPITKTFPSPLPGEDVWWYVPVTDLSGVYKDARRNEVIILEAGQHSHLYITTLTVLDGDEVVGEPYVYGPYPVPTDELTLDLDTDLVEGETTGVTVTVPAWWQGIIEDAQAAVDEIAPVVKTVGELEALTSTGRLSVSGVAGVATDAVAPVAEAVADLETLTTDGRLGEAGLSATFVRFVDQNGDPLPAGCVTTIHVNTVTGDIDDITFEEA